MPITVRLHFPLTAFTKGQKKVVLDWEGGELKDVIETLASRYDRGIKETLLDENGLVDTGYCIFLNGSRVSDLSTPVQDNADIYVIMPIPGGCTSQEINCTE